MFRLNSIEKEEEEEEEEEEGTRPHSFRTSPPSPDSRRRVAFVAMFTTRAHVRRRPNITTVSFLLLLLFFLCRFCRFGKKHPSSILFFFAIKTHHLLTRYPPHITHTHVVSVRRKQTNKKNREHTCASLR